MGARKIYSSIETIIYIMLHIIYMHIYNNKHKNLFMDYANALMIKYLGLYYQRTCSECPLEK